MLAIQQPRAGRQHPKTTPSPTASARAAGLRYVTDRRRGIARERLGRGFTYFNPDGTRVTDRATRARIKSLAIPPAWTEVWICPNPFGHIQATGRDARGRKQYRYHPDYRKVREQTKYERMIAFGDALPELRDRVGRDLSRKGLPREKVLATVVRLLETTLIRVGNEEYARHNNSFGLTTMRNRHVKVNGSQLQFHFRGKRGVFHDVDVNHKRLARIIERLHELPAQELSAYLDHDGKRHAVDSGDVNDYLREITGQDFTAKDFRTWTGTVLAAAALRKFESFDSHAEAKRNIVNAIESVAQRLGNTPTVCRECYVHPVVLESYLDGTLVQSLKAAVEQELSETIGTLPAEEAAVLAFLQQSLSCDE